MQQYTSLYTHTNIHMHPCIRIHGCVCIFVYVYSDVYMDACVYHKVVYVHSIHGFMCIFVYVYSDVYVYMYVYVCLCVFVCVCVTCVYTLSTRVRMHTFCVQVCPFCIMCIHVDVVSCLSEAQHIRLQCCSQHSVVSACNPLPLRRCCLLEQHVEQA